MKNSAGGAFAEVVGFTTPFTLNSILITTNIASGTKYNF
jgi:hypothetical protein